MIHRRSTGRGAQISNWHITTRKASPTCCILQALFPSSLGRTGSRLAWSITCWSVASQPLHASAVLCRFKENRGQGGTQAVHKYVKAVRTKVVRSCVRRFVRRSYEAAQFWQSEEFISFTHVRYQAYALSEIVSLSTAINL